MRVLKATLIVASSALISFAVLYWRTAGFLSPIQYSQSYFSQIIPTARPTHASIASSTAQVVPVASVSATLRVPIITYHYVEYVQNPLDTMRRKLAINPALFEQQVKSLHDHQVETYFVKEIPALLKGTKPLASKSAVLTFDDGYRDFYFNAFPILKKYQTKGTIYLISNFLDRRDFLTVAQVKEMLSSGLIEVGSHTLNHGYLKKGKLDYVTNEVVQSKVNLEKLFDIKVETFAYPYGGFDDQAVKVVKEASYSAAVSTLPGVFQSDDNLYTLSRWRAGALNGIYSADSLEKLK